jgi:hypothetical protein
VMDGKVPASVRRQSAGTAAPAEITMRSPGTRGLHSFPFPLNLSLPCPFTLNYSSLCPPYDPN